MSKITVDTKKLAKELSYVGKLILNNPTNPLWINVLLETEGSTLRLTGTNGTNAASTFITLENPTKESFQAAIAAKKFTDIVKAIKQDKVTISKSDSRITITAGKGKYVFGLSPDAVASIKTFQNMGGDGEVFTVNAKKAINLVSVANMFAADQETTKYTLMGVKLQATDSILKVTAMDGQRAIDLFVEDRQDDRNANIFIPVEGAELMADIEDGDEIKFNVGSIIRMECGNRVALVRRAASENLPDISLFINKYMEKNEITATVESTLLRDTVKRLQIAIDGNLRKIMFQTNEGSLTLKSKDPMGACQEFEEELVGTIKGSGEFSLNAAYVLDYTKVETGLVTIHCNPSFPNAAVVITNGNGFRCMISQVK